MPTYDYVCQACDHAFEAFHSISAKPLKKCPECGKPRLKRLIGTGAGIIFKGSGFYETDYRSSSYTAAAKADKESSSAASSETKAAKPDAPSKKADAPKGKKAAASSAPAKASTSAKD